MYVNYDNTPTPDPIIIISKTFLQGGRESVGEFSPPPTERLDTFATPVPKHPSATPVTKIP